jgi:hypothetical protein
VDKNYDLLLSRGKLAVAHMTVL